MLSRGSSVVGGHRATLVASGQSVDRDATAARVLRLTRDAKWTRADAIPIKFRTFHPQGMVKIDEHFYVSSVEVHDRAAGKGIGHLFKIDRGGILVEAIPLGEGAMYHPGGLDFDGTHIWVAVAEYRPDSRSIIYRIDPQTMKAERLFTVPDHIGAIVHNLADNTLHGASWGSRRFYRWTLDGKGSASNNPSHYVDYQDCKYAGDGAHALHRCHRDPSAERVALSAWRSGARGPPGGSTRSTRFRFCCGPRAAST